MVHVKFKVVLPSAIKDPSVVNLELLGGTEMNIYIRGCEYLQ